MRSEPPYHRSGIPNPTIWRQDLQPLDRKIYRPDYFGFLTDKSHSVVMITAYEPESVDNLLPGRMKYRNRELFTADAWRQYLPRFAKPIASSQSN